MISINVCNGGYMCSFFMSFPYVRIFMMGCYFYTYKSKVKVIVITSHFEKQTNLLFKTLKLFIRKYKKVK